VGLAGPLWDDTTRLRHLRPGLQDYSLWLAPGTLPRRCRPTDLDGVLHDGVQDKCFIFELKSRPIVPTGQLRTLAHFARQGDWVVVIVDPLAERTPRLEGIDTLSGETVVRLAWVSGSMTKDTELEWNDTTLTQLCAYIKDFFAGGDRQ
jgi:hypothetical protein